MSRISKCSSCRVLSGNSKIAHAPSKEIVVRLCNETFINRNVTKPPKDVHESITQHLGITAKESTELFTALQGLVKSAVFQGSTDPSDILRLFPEDFHKNLRDLIGKILIDRLSVWKTHALNNMVSLPRLVDFDWRVDVKTASNSLARMSVPTCLLQLQIQETSSESTQKAETSTLNVELSKETLETMLDGLGKIRDQLNSVAKRS